MWPFQLTLTGLALFFQLHTLTSCQNSSVMINTRLGRVKGLQFQTVWKNVTFYSFLGLRYAEPLIGEKKFDVKKIYNLFLYYY